MLRSAREQPCSALLALEDLYARAGDWAALAGVYSRQAEAFVEPSAKLAALRELARVQEVNGVGAPGERARTHEQNPRARARRRGRFARLAEAARQTGDEAVLERVYARLAELETDATVAAEWQLRMAQMLEAASARRRWPRIEASCARCPTACRPCGAWPAWRRRTPIPGRGWRRCDARRP